MQDVYYKSLNIIVVYLDDETYMKVDVDLKSHGAIVSEPGNIAVHLLYHQDYVQIDLDLESHENVTLKCLDIVLVYLDN